MWKQRKGYYHVYFVELNVSSSSCCSPLSDPLRRCCSFSVTVLRKVFFSARWLRPELLFPPDLGAVACCPASLGDCPLGGSNRRCSRREEQTRPVSWLPRDPEESPALCCYPEWLLLLKDLSPSSVRFLDTASPLHLTLVPSVSVGCTDKEYGCMCEWHVSERAFLGSHWCGKWKYWITKREIVLPHSWLHCDDVRVNYCSSTLEKGLFWPGLSKPQLSANPGQPAAVNVSQVLLTYHHVHCPRAVLLHCCRGLIPRVIRVSSAKAETLLGLSQKPSAPSWFRWIHDSRGAGLRRTSS